MECSEFPSDLCISGVKKTSFRSDSSTSEVWNGTFDDNEVAIKILHIHGEYDPQKLRRVSPFRTEDMIDFLPCRRISARKLFTGVDSLTRTFSSLVVSGLPKRVRWLLCRPG
jgi:hypothetical protein